jgi:UDP:flavonoid glycosyltransferase YjiC (YdhE family)
VLVTWGGSSARWDPRLDVGTWVARAVAELPVEVVLVTAGGADAELAELAARPNVRVARNVAINLLLPGCDLMVAHGGLGTLLTALTCGVPQLTLPQIADRVLNARQLAATGAGDFAFVSDCDEDGLRGRVTAILDDPAYAAAAARLRQEAAGLDAPPDVVRVLADRYTPQGGTS